MLNLATQYQIALLQSHLLEWKLLQSEGLLERKEDWRDAKVVRDATGKFASTGKTLSEATENIKSVFSPAHFKEIEKSLRISLSKGTAEVRDILDNSFGKRAEVWRKEVADNFGDLTDGMREAILKNPFPGLTSKANEAIAILDQYKNKAIDAATQNAIAKEITDLFNTAKAQYDQTIYGLEHLEDKPKLVQFLGKAVAELIPQAVLIGSFYAGGMFASWVLFSALLPAGVPIGGGSAIVFRAPPLARIAQDVAVFAASSEAVKLDREARGIDEKTLESLPWWRRLGAEARATCIYFFAAGAIGLGTAVADGTLIKLAKKSISEARAYVIARKDLPAQVQATLAEVRRNFPKKQELVEKKIAQLAEEYKDAKLMPPDVAAHVYKKAIKFEADLLDRFKHIPDFPELMEAANINITKAIHEAEIHIRAPDPAVLAILNSRFKTTFETNTRAMKSYIQKRSRVEKNFFGLGKDHPPEKRPIYGYFARPGNAAKLEGANTDYYGEIAIRLKPSTKRRATFLGHDSFWADDMGSVSSTHDVPTVGTFLSGKEDEVETVRIISSLAKAKDIEEIRQIAGTVKIPGTDILAKASYLEAVVHGGVDVSDIAEIIFPYFPNGEDTVYKKYLKLRSAGISTGEASVDEMLDTIVDIIKTAKDKGIQVTFGDG
jgi:hypothetical protein